MAEETSLLEQAFAECGEQLDRIIAVLQRKDLAKTYVYRLNETVDEYEIVGELRQNSIPSGNTIVKVEIGNKVTSIGNNAFDYNGYAINFTSIVIPSSVTSIGGWAFYRCSGLTSVTIPDGVTSIGGGVFFNCYGLTSVTIPDSVTSIGEYAFCGCSGLTTITIPDSVTSIGERAFVDCYGLTSITIPNGVTSIGDAAFYNTSIMDSTFVNKTMEQVQAMEYYPWGLPADGIIHCSDGDLVVPESSGGSGS